MKRKTKRLITVECWTETITTPLGSDDATICCVQCGAALNVGDVDRIRENLTLCTPDDCAGSDEREQR